MAENLRRIQQNEIDPADYYTQWINALSSVGKAAHEYVKTYCTTFMHQHHEQRDHLNFLFFLFNIIDDNCLQKHIMNLF